MRASAALFLRMALFAVVLVGPVGAFAAVQGDKAPGIQGAGLVLLVSIQRAG
ncbi:hypothetical protein GCM10011491_21860 [Brucella endophytica]|uniref:Uncharacterized protein n=2 Tax=Brucella endophytica TaxID=1963359 RepID=A0A916SCD2_9HYPH|nr:hypothetical protein GCM10011491_21860 [Brucella endophytica]